ncbi:NAC domain-containing protein 14 [Spatholobus suberectus]|nr:NAC domain-containing protein 14 [Spatholobus suberectus]
MEIVGLGFRPTDEELVDFYLKHKLLHDDPGVLIIPEIDLCDVEPWEVPGRYFYRNWNNLSGSASDREILLPNTTVSNWY